MPTMYENCDLLILDACMGWLGSKMRRCTDLSGNEWGRLLIKSTQNKVLPIVAEHLAQAEFASTLHRGNVRSIFSDVLAATQIKVSMQSEKAKAVQEALNAAGVAVRWRKGVVYNTLLYRQKGLRRGADVDVFIKESDRILFTSIMQDLGFHHGSYSYESANVIDLPRAQKLAYTMYPDHILPLVSKVKSPFLAYFRVDASMNISWFNCIDRDQLEKILYSAFIASPILTPDGLHTVNRAVHFVDCCLHSYRELHLRTARESDNRGEISLHKLLDVACLLKNANPEEIEMIHELCRIDFLGNACREIVGYAEAIFETDLINLLPPAPDRDGGGNNGSSHWNASSVAQHIFRER